MIFQVAEGLVAIERLKPDSVACDAGGSDDVAEGLFAIERLKQERVPLYLD